MMWKYFSYMRKQLVWRSIIGCVCVLDKETEGQCLKLTEINEEKRISHSHAILFSANPFSKHLTVGAALPQPWPVRNV